MHVQRGNRFGHDHGTNEAATVARTAGGQIEVGGVQCGTATVTNTDKITVTGALGRQAVRLDLANGGLAPGATAEGTGTSEIELEIDLMTGNETTAQPDTRHGQRTGAADTLRLGTLGINANGDNDADITGPAGGATTTIRAELFEISGLGGPDVISGAASADVGGAFPIAPATTLDGGPAADQLTGGDSSDTLIGGPGNDTENGGNNLDVFNEEAVANGNDDFVGGGSPYDTLDYGAALGRRHRRPRRRRRRRAAGGRERQRPFGHPRSSRAAPAATRSPTTPASSRHGSSSGGGGNDTITGGPAGDILYGQAGNDTMHGGPQGDTLYGGQGDDDEFGDAGVDRFYEDSDLGRGPDHRPERRGRDLRRNGGRRCHLRPADHRPGRDDGRTGSRTTVPTPRRAAPLRRATTSPPTSRTSPARPSAPTTSPGTRSTTSSPAAVSTTPSAVWAARTT